MQSNHVSILLCLLLATCAESVHARAEEPSAKYTEVLAALQGGKQVEVVLDLSRCVTSDSGKPAPAIQGGLRINSFRVTPQTGIAFSDTHQTLDASERPITECLRYRLSREGKLTLRASKLNAATNEVVKQGEFICELPDGAKFIW